MYTVEKIDINGAEIQLDKNAKISQKIFLTCEGINNKIILKSNSKLGTLGTPKIEFLGNNNTLYLGCNTIIKRGHYRFVGDNNLIDIGDKTTINGAYMLCEDASTIKIGKDCLLSYELEFRTTDAHSIFTRDSNILINPPDSISIGDHVWIGKSACIMQGVTISNNNIIGIRSLVTKSFSDEYTSIAGVPAKIISTNVDWNRHPPKRQ
jgi:acetyltransferase-like isoleucine patch superfamily enzyme